MAGFLDLLKAFGPSLLDTAGSLVTNNMGTQAANAAADRTQFMPYNLNIAGNTGNFSGASGTANFSGPNQANYNGLQGLLGGAIGQASQGTPNYLNQAYGDGTGPQANQGLNTAANGYLGAGNQFLQQAQGQLGGVPGWQDAYNQQLALMRQGAQPQEDRLRSGNYDNQFSKGILASTAGQYQTQGLESALAGADLQRQQQAFSQAQQFQQGQQALGLNTLGAGLNSSGLGQSLSTGYFNQAGQSVNDRLTRALQMFGAQTQGAQANQNLVSGYLGNTQGLENGLQNLLGLGGYLGSAQSSANTPGAAAQYKTATTNAGNIQGILGNIDWGKLFSGNPSVAGGTGGLLGGLDPTAGAGALAPSNFAIPSSTSEAISAGLAPEATSAAAAGAAPAFGAFSSVAPEMAAPNLGAISSAADAMGANASAAVGGQLGWAGGLGVMGGALLGAGILSNNDGLDQYGMSQSTYDGIARSMGFKDNADYLQWRQSQPTPDTFSQPGFGSTVPGQLNPYFNNLPRAWMGS